MKTLVTITLCLALLGAQAQTNLPPAKPKPEGGLLAGLVLVCGVVAGWMIIRAVYSGPPQTTPVNLVLLQSTDGRATWTTNCIAYSIILGKSNPLELMMQKIGGGDDTTLYRLRVDTASNPP